MEAGESQFSELRGKAQISVLSVTRMCTNVSSLSTLEGFQWKPANLSFLSCRESPESQFSRSEGSAPISVTDRRASKSAHTADVLGMRPRCPCRCVVVDDVPKGGHIPGRVGDDVVSREASQLVCVPGADEEESDDASSLDCEPMRPVLVPEEADEGQVGRSPDGHGNPAIVW